MRRLLKFMSVCVIFAAAFSCTDPVQEGVEVAGVSLDKNELRLEVGESGNLVATVVPANADDKSVVWSSQDENVAVVSESGVVTGAAVGKTAVVVTTVDGGFTAECAVEVYESDEPADVEDLSASATANSYVIMAAGSYRFNAAVRGNGVATDGSEAAPLTPVSAFLVWQTDPGMIASVALEDGYIVFEAADKPGNALIAAGDADGNIIWSWHIWYPKEEIASMATKTGYEVMNMNLGALVTGKLPLENAECYGMLYQWGRKDPFPNSLSVTGDQTTVGQPLYDIDGGSVAITNSPWESTADNTLEYSIAHPTVCLSNMAHFAESHDWLAVSDDALWGNPDGRDRDENLEYVNKGFKSLYDPCPAGWRVPPVDVFASFTSAGQTSPAFTYEEFNVEDLNGDGLISIDDFAHGWKFNVEDGSMFFPAAARYDGSYAMLMGSVCGLWGAYWSNSPGSADYGYGGTGFSPLTFNDSLVSLAASASRADAYSVRCVRE